MEYESVIGLEVHVQLATKTKMFCRCANSFGAEPNSSICPVCSAMPGALPVLNRQGLRLGLRVALALGCEIQRDLIFERKNYFYPDLPKGYQISQLMRPLGEKGDVDLIYRKVRVNRAHLEEDAGKSMHESDHSLVDLNRCGVPLLEIVTEPDMSLPQEAYDYLTALKLIVQYAGGSSCDMEKGFLRCDANISIRPKGDKKLGTKTELKNMNSFKAVKEALEFEIKRQKKVVLDGGKITQETRLWDEVKRKTLVMRSKEEAHDYRYFPEPDLVNYKLTDKDIEEQKDLVGELPLEKRERFKAEYALNDKDIDSLISDKNLSIFFEKVLKTFNNPKKVCNWIIGPVSENLNEKNLTIVELNLKPEILGEIVKLMDEGTVTNLVAKDILKDHLQSGKNPADIIKEKGLEQVSSSDELDKMADEIIDKNPKAVEDFKAGKDSSVMFLVGQVMRQTKGRANPKMLQELFKTKLKEL